MVFVFTHVNTLHVKKAKNINCIRFIDNYTIQNHTQSSSFRSVYYTYSHHWQ